MLVSFLCVNPAKAKADSFVPSTEEKSGYMNEKGEFIEYSNSPKVETKEDSKVVATIKEASTGFWQTTKKFIPVILILGVVMVVMFFVVKPVKSSEINTEQKIK